MRPRAGANVELDRRLARCLRADDSSRTERSRGTGEWIELVARAVSGGLAGILAESCRRLGVELPESASRIVRRAELRVAARNLRYMVEAERILAQFHRYGVPVLLLKGVALQRTLYPSPQLRPMTDLDLLVRPRDVNRARAVMADLGWRRGFDLVHPDFFPRFHYEVEYLSPDSNPTRIDLHVRPFRPLRFAALIGADEMWVGAAPVDLGTVSGLVPSPSRMLVHLAAHAAFHGFSRLLWLYDLHRYVATWTGTIDWDDFVRTCRAWRLTESVRRTIDRTQDWFGTVWPVEAAGQFSGHRAGPAERLLLWQAPRAGRAPVLNVLVELVTTPDWRLRFGYLGAYLRPGQAHLRSAYPGQHFGWRWIAHFRRVLRQVGRGGGVVHRAVSRVLGRPPAVVAGR